VVHSPFDLRAEVGQELNGRLGGGVFVGIESVHAALNEFECCGDGFFFLRSSFFVRSSCFFISRVLFPEHSVTAFLW
jgi:hypothetical protein